MQVRRRVLLAAVAMTSLAALAGCATTPSEPTLVRINLFQGASNVGTYVAEARGMFAKRGIKITTEFTPNSELQRAGLAAGRFDIAHAAIDNAVAMVEVAKHDVIVFMGGDGSMNEFMARAEIASLAQVRGQKLAVDAPNTAYALVARKVLKNLGLVDGRDYQLAPVGGTPSRVAAMTEKSDHVAGMLNPPWSFIARERGLKSLGTSLDMFGPYQASGGFVMRNWAQANADTLERYTAALIEAQRYVMNPANRADVIAILSERLKLKPEHAVATYNALLVPRSGLARDAAVDMEGFRNVLAVRAEIEGQWGGKPPAVDKYLDLSYFNRALARVNQNR
jgi:ABC-type nitrate/sulfonate/bicarbonate transport system substrate-binding protein